jgi:hypothetical protein
VHAFFLVLEEAAIEAIGARCEAEASCRLRFSWRFRDFQRRFFAAFAFELEVVRVVTRVVELDDYVAGGHFRSGEGVAVLGCFDAEMR